MPQQAVYHRKWSFGFSHSHKYCHHLFSSLLFSRTASHLPQQQDAVHLKDKQAILLQNKKAADAIASTAFLDKTLLRKPALQRFFSISIEGKETFAGREHLMVMERN